MHIAIINGPNLNLLGMREVSVYGKQSFDDFLAELAIQYPDVLFSYYQSNVEGEIVNDIQEMGFTANGILINAGAYTHTSIAIADAISAVKSPAIEIHISNISAREPFRHESYLTSKCVGMISGLGLDGYRLGVEYFIKNLKK